MRSLAAFLIMGLATTAIMVAAARADMSASAAYFTLARGGLPVLIECVVLAEGVGPRHLPECGRRTSR